MCLYRRKEPVKVYSHSTTHHNWRQGAIKQQCRGWIVGLFVLGVGVVAPVPVPVSLPPPAAQVGFGTFHLDVGCSDLPVGTLMSEASSCGRELSRFALSALSCMAE